MIQNIHYFKDFNCVNCEKITRQSTTSGTPESERLSTLCTNNCPDYNGMEILHKENCTCECHQLKNITSHLCFCYRKCKCQDEREKLITEIENLITEEMLICHHENTPTSRLTSLVMAIKNLKS